MRARCASYTGFAASSAARAVPSTRTGAPPAAATDQVSRIVAPARFRRYCASVPFQDHQKSSTGGPIQSGSAIACASVSTGASVVAVAGIAAACGCATAGSATASDRNSAAFAGTGERWKDSRMAGSGP